MTSEIRLMAVETGVYPRCVIQWVTDGKIEQGAGLPWWQAKQRFEQEVQKYPGGYYHRPRTEKRTNPNPRDPNSALLNRLTLPLGAEFKRDKYGYNSAGIWTIVEEAK